MSSRRRNPSGVVEETVEEQRKTITETRRQQLEYLFRTKKNKWNARRWHSFVLYNYTFRIASLPGFATKSDLQSLKAFVDDEEEPIHFRVEAAFTLAGFYIDDETVISNDYELSMDYFRQILGFVEQATKQERNRRLPKLEKLLPPSLGPSPGYDWTSVGDYLDNRKEQVEKYVEHVEANRFGARTKQAANSLLKDIHGNRGITQHVADIIDRSTSCGGSYCDYCKRTRKALGVATLLCCSRCQMVYYCSKECQTKQWRAGHKQACRKKGEIKVGDYMKIRGGKGDPIVVLSAVPDEIDMWEVKFLALNLEPMGDSMFLPSSNLDHIRPEK